MGQPPELQRPIEPPSVCRHGTVVRVVGPQGQRIVQAQRRRTKDDANVRLKDGRMFTERPKNRSTVRG